MTEQEHAMTTSPEPNTSPSLGRGRETGDAPSRWLRVAAGLLGLVVLAGVYAVAYAAPPGFADDPVWLTVALVALTGCLWAIHAHSTIPEGRRIRRTGRNPLWWPVLWLWGTLVFAVAFSALSFLPGDAMDRFAGAGVSEAGGFSGVVWWGVVTVGMIFLVLAATVMMFVWIGLGSVALFVWSTWNAIPAPRPSPGEHETTGSEPRVTGTP